MSFYKTYQSYRNAWGQAYEKDPPIPLNIDLELASLCNLRCPFCFIPDPSFEKFIYTQTEDGQSRRRLMPVDLAFKIIDQAAELGVPSLKFNWRGESTIHPNYSQIVRYAKNKSAFIDLLANTNGNCKEHAIEGLALMTKCMISIDSFDYLVYEKMRTGGKLNWALDTVDKLIGHPNLWVRRVISKDNKEEDFIGTAHRMWNGKVKASEHFCFDRNESSKHESGGCEHDDYLNRQYCGYPSQRLVIASTGYVYPCCIDLHETMPVGDVNNQTLIEIWHGDPLKRLREELKQNVFQSESCRKCQSWMAYKAPQRDYVQDRENERAKLAV